MNRFRAAWMVLTGRMRATELGQEVLDRARREADFHGADVSDLVGAALEIYGPGTPGSPDRMSESGSAVEETRSALQKLHEYNRNYRSFVLETLEDALQEYHEQIGVALMAELGEREVLDDAKSILNQAWKETQG